MLSTDDRMEYFIDARQRQTMRIACTQEDLIERQVLRDQPSHDIRILSLPMANEETATPQNDPPSPENPPHLPDCCGWNKWSMDFLDRSSLERSPDGSLGEDVV
jgi:hypothetical protein